MTEIIVDIKQITDKQEVGNVVMQAYELCESQLYFSAAKLTLSEIKCVEKYSPVISYAVVNLKDNMLDFFDWCYTFMEANKITAEEAVLIYRRNKHIENILL